MIDPHCKECNGEGHADYGRGEDTEELPCQKCFPPEKGQTVTSWEDLRDDYDDRHDDD
jgi:hypothetical protein